MEQVDVNNWTTYEKLYYALKDVEIKTGEFTKPVNVLSHKASPGSDGIHTLL